MSILTDRTRNRAKKGCASTSLLTACELCNWLRTTQQLDGPSSYENPAPPPSSHSLLGSARWMLICFGTPVTPSLPKPVKFPG